MCIRDSPITLIRTDPENGRSAADYEISSASLGAIEGSISSPEKILDRVEASRWISRNADTCGHANILARPNRKPVRCKAVANTLGKCNCSLLARFGQHDHELFAAIACDSVHTSHGPLKKRGHREQHV